MKLAIFLEHVLKMAEQEQMSIPEALKTVKSLGYDYVEADANTFFGREDEWLDMLKEAGLRVGGMYLFFDFAHAPENEKADALVELAVKMGASAVMAIPGFLAEGDDPAEIETRMAKALNELANKLEDKDVKLVLEDFDGATASFGDLKGLKSMLTLVPKLGCAFDTGNFVFHGDDLFEAYDLLHDHICHIHLKDRVEDRTYGQDELNCVTGRKLYPAPIGSGVMRLGEILRMLKESGYSGIYAIEHFGADDMLDCMTQSIRWVKAQLA